MRGKSRKTGEVGRLFLEYGEAYSDNRCTTLGHLYEAIGHFICGDFSSAIECYERAIEVSVDPMFRNLSKQMFGFCLAADNQADRARTNLEAVLEYNKIAGGNFLGSQAQASMVLVHLTKGELGKGMRLAEVTKRVYLANGSKYRAANIEFFSGKVYLQMLERSRPMSVSLLLKNIVFLIKNLPFAGKKSEAHFSRAIKIANEIGARGVVAQSHLGLGNLHRIKGKAEQARDDLSKAIEIFKETGADVFLKQAERALASLKKG